MPWPFFAAVQASHAPPHAWLQHTPSAHVRPLAQSEVALHFLPCAQRVAQVPLPLAVPPQSTSVSLPSCLPSSQSRLPPQPSETLPHVVGGLVGCADPDWHVKALHPQLGWLQTPFAGGMHCAAVVQPEHLPPLHERPVPQSIPSGADAVPGVDPLQVPTVQPWLVLAGTLALSVTVMVPPLPSQTICRQSPGICAGFVVVAVPDAVNTGAQRLCALQPGCWQSLVMLVPEHSLSCVHCEQVPAASQKPGLVPSHVLHCESTGWSGKVGVPLSHTPSAQPAMPVGTVGTSLSSTEFLLSPPRQIWTWQSPATCVTPGVGVPSETFT
jgi:hypothetical protein